MLKTGITHRFALLLVSAYDCIPEVVLKKCGTELRYGLAELFKMGLRESCFPDCWKVTLVVHVLKNVGYHPVRSFCG